MSRLDTFIGRLLAQKACIGLARSLIGPIDGPVLELGLGNGRTYDHLRELFPERSIFVVERQPGPHPACMPPADRLIVAELRDALPDADRWLPAPAAFAHSDIGTADPERNARLAAWLAGALPPLLADGAVVASDQALDDRRLAAMKLPDDVPGGRYHLYRHHGSPR